MDTKLQPSHFSLDFAIRPNILAFPRYVTSTSDEAQARPFICLDANENSAGSCLASRTTLGKRKPSCVVDLDGINRYPPASQGRLKRCILEWRQLQSTYQLCLGSGASDILDLIIRVTCIPSRDKILVTPPAFELYRVCATLHDIGIQECQQEYTQEVGFRLPMEEICTTLVSDNTIKVVLLASPGNPTGSLIPLTEIRRILDLEAFQGLVVVDEAYIDFAAFPEQASAVSLLSMYDNLVVVQSLSKSHGLAGLRIGMAMAHPVITGILAKVQMPYKISSVALDLACRALAPKGRSVVRQLQCQVIVNRGMLASGLNRPGLAQGGVGHPISGTAANFVVVPIFARGQPRDGGERDNQRAMKVVARLREKHGIAVRYIGHQAICKACIRITVGTSSEIEALLQALEQVVDEL